MQCADIDRVAQVSEDYTVRDEHMQKSLGYRKSIRYQEKSNRSDVLNTDQF